MVALNRRPPVPATGPGGADELLAAGRDPARMAGLVATDRDPRDLPAPPGAQRRWAFRRKTGGIVQELAAYDHAGPAEGVLDHYTRVLTRQGFGRVPLASSSGASQRAIFRKGRTHVAISLRKHDKHAKLVRVRAVMTRYGPP